MIKSTQNTWMLHNYLIEILIMMLNIIASYNKLLYTIINIEYEITTTSKINSPFWNSKFFRVPRVLKLLLRVGAGEGGGSQFCFTVPKILWRD